MVALEDCLLLTIDQTDFRSFINILPDLRLAIETSMKVRRGHVHGADTDRCHTHLVS